MNHSLFSRLATPIVSGMIFAVSATLAVAQNTADPGLVARGQYLTQAADCQACHTVPGGQPFTGGRDFKLPFGVIYSPNITPDKDTGIGNWSDDDFVRALHQGIGKDGEHLYPAFPYTSYSGMSREDALAIKAYLFSLPPMHAPAKQNALSFPFNQRWGMTFWNALYFTDARFQPDPKQSADWNRGNYLANVLGHCGECHTPRTAAYGLDSSKAFAGSPVDGWRAYNISSDKDHGLGNWTDEQLESYLSNGYADGRGAASGPMEEVVRLSLSHLTKEDIHALATYLRSVPPQASSDDPVVDPEPPALRDAAYVPSSTDPSVGQRIFEGSCASCHGWDGSGLQTPYAALKGSGAANDTEALNLVQVVLNGQTVHTANGDMRMPAFANALTDTEIAAVANFVVDRFGGKQAGITAETVAKMRSGEQDLGILALAKWIIPAILVIVLVIAALLVTRRGRQTPYPA